MTEIVVAVTIGRANYSRMFSSDAWDALAELKNDLPRKT